MKKLLSTLLSVAILMTCIGGISLEASAASVVASGSCGASGSNMSWELSSDGVMTIKGSNQRMADFSTKNRPGWYGNRADIKELVVQDGVINIGAYAFADCSNMRKVSFGTIDTIGNNAFESCTSLQKADLPDGCNWIWTAVFKGCTSLIYASINAVRSYDGCVPDEMFRNCTSLQTVKLGNSITKFNANSFNGCSSLVGIITEADSLSTANSNAFNGVTKSNVTICSKKGGAQSFAGNNGFAYSNEFGGICSDNTYSASRLSWHYNKDSGELSFTGSGDMAFYENGRQPWYRFIGGISKVSFAGTDAKVSTSTTAFAGAKAIESVDMTNVYSIGWASFQSCTNLSGRIAFDSELWKIWGYAFENCVGIDSLTFKEPDDDHELQFDVGAFKNCTGTTYWLNLPYNTTVIADEAFFGTGFNYTTIDSDRVTIGKDAFGNGTGGYARFFGKDGADTGVYSYVKDCVEKYHYDWHYYCKNGNHIYTTKMVYPTCAERGYDLYYCKYCDTDQSKSNYTEPRDHDYMVTRTQDNEFIYMCNRCSKTNIYVPAIDLIRSFNKSISQTAGTTMYMQKNYNGKIDVNNDGVINARDFLLIRDATKAYKLTNKETVINDSVTYQTIEGFGASACWWSQTVGGWDTAEDILSLLYDRNDGIGLNIYRYNLGAGSRDINDTSMYIDGERTNCFLQADGTYDWDNDANAMSALYYARKHNPNLKVTLFSNSAPVYMTINGRAYCNPVNSDGTFNANMSESNYQAFATFVERCAEHFIDEGYNVTSVSPINEPEWSWAGWVNGDGGLSMNQEGCNWTSDEAVKFYNNYMIPTLMRNPRLNGRVDVSVWESGQMDHWQYWTPFLNQSFSTDQQYSSGNENIRKYVDSVDTHSYWANSDARSNVANQLSNLSAVKKVRCTEYCQMGTDGSSGVYGRIYRDGMTNGMGIEYALAMADIIHQDLTIINAVEWDWWTAVGRGIYTDSLIYVNDNDHNDIQPAKRLYALGNYSKFIDEGAKRIQVSTGVDFGKNLRTEETCSWTDDWGTYTDKNNYIEQSAYKNPDGSVVVVYINNSDTNEFTTFDAATYGKFEAYVTDRTRNLEQNQDGYIGDTAIVIPAKSITTVVLHDGTQPAESTDGAYLFTYFTGNSQDEQRIRFAISDDGYNFTPLNANQSVVAQTKGTLNCRDPYIFKGNDGYYYIVATDMDASGNIWWGNSKTMVYWRSRDLVNWGDETIIDMTALLPGNDINRCWAPQVIWDSDEQRYMVYFSLAAWPYTGNGTFLYYCYTDDLLNQEHYSTPQLLYKPKNGGAAIDGDIIYNAEKKLYYLYYKDEEKATICYVTSDKLTGPYRDWANPTIAVKTNVGLEGCNSYFITGTSTLVMLADAYGDGYFVMNQSRDFDHFNTIKSTDYTINNCSPRHGSVVPITTAEKANLLNRFGY